MQNILEELHYIGDNWRNLKKAFANKHSEFSDIVFLTLLYLQWVHLYHKQMFSVINVVQIVASSLSTRWTIRYLSSYGSALLAVLVHYSAYPTCPMSPLKCFTVIVDLTRVLTHTAQHWLNQLPSHPAFCSASIASYGDCEHSLPVTNCSSRGQLPLYTFGGNRFLLQLV